MGVSPSWGIMGSFKTKGNMLLLQLSCPEYHIHHMIPGQVACAPNSYAPLFLSPSPDYTHQSHLLGFGGGLAVPGEVWEDHVLDDATRSLFQSGMSQRCVDNPLMRWPWDFCWTLSSSLLTGVFPCSSALAGSVLSLRVNLHLLFSD